MFGRGSRIRHSVAEPDEAFSALRDVARQDGIALTAVAQAMVAQAMVDGSRELVAVRRSATSAATGD